MIHDLWFQTDLELHELATRLEWRDINFGADDRWIWITGWFGDEDEQVFELDLTRTHLGDEAAADTRLSMIDAEDTFSAELLEQLGQALLAIDVRPIHCGRWVVQDDGTYELHSKRQIV